MASADYHRQGAAQIRTDGARVAELETLLESAYARWAELDARAAAGPQRSSR